MSGTNREDAVATLQQALAATAFEGVETTVGLHRLIAADPRFTAGAVDTRFFEGMAHG